VYLPKINITGTFGGSNFTFPTFCIGVIPLFGVLIPDVDLALPPFQSVPESSCAAVFDSENDQKNKSN
jgi:hypothetical protein